MSKIIKVFPSLLFFILLCGGILKIRTLPLEFDSNSYTTAMSAPWSFKSTVKERASEIEDKVLRRLSIDNIDLAQVKNSNNLTIVVDKEKGEFYLFASQPEPKLLKKYKMTAFSGKTGPKNNEGDRQIPEGAYPIEGLNPNSRYHLSLKLNYPNSLDLKRARLNKVSNPGSNIFIHGKKVTIGRIPLGDKGIEEVFYLVNKVGKSKTTVLITPTLNLKSFQAQSFSRSSKDLALLKEKYSNLAKNLSSLPLD